jgi:hypothetical protein
MPRSRPIRQLAQSAGTGLRELPSNAAWLLSQVLPTEETGPAAGPRDTARRIKATIEDATPMGDSVETRLKRARAAAERAQRAEEEALAAAEESKRSSDYARIVAERNRTQIAELKRDLKQRVEHAVTEARRAAAERIEDERAAAQSEADQELESRQGAAEEETQGAKRDAETAQQRAKELVTEAQERLAEARALAEEATRAARATAEEAHRQAQQLAAEAQHQAQAADERVAAAEQIGNAAVSTPIDGDLEARTKAELLDIAAAMDIEGRAAMSEAELISAIEEGRT